MSPRDRLAVAVALAAVPVRVALALTSALSPDEAYYAGAARLGITIPDHPPAVVLAARCGWAMPDALPLEVRMRAAPLLLGTIVSLLLVEISRRSDGSPAAQRWTAILGSWLLLPLAGGFLATPDVAVFLATLVLLDQESKPHPGIAGEIAVFASVFLGMLAKVIIAPVALAVALTSRRSPLHRLLPLAGILASLPWVMESLGFQLRHAFAASSDAPVGPIPALAAAIAAQLLLWTPAVPFLAVRGLRSLPLPCAAASGTLVVLFLLSAIVRGTPPEPNWIAPAFAPLLPTVAAALAVSSRAVRITTVTIGPVVALLAASHVIHPWLPVPSRLDPSARLRHPLSEAAPGIGAYAAPALHCVTTGECEQLRVYIQTVRGDSGSAR